MLESLIAIGLPISLFLIMIGVGLGLTPRDFGRVLVKPKAFIIGATCQLILLPAVAVFVVYITNLPGEVAIGLIILALCPSGTTSNLYTMLARGDVGLSVTLTATMGFITPFVIPYFGMMAINHFADADKQFDLPLVKTWLQLIVITVVPVILGMIIRGRSATFAKRVEPFMNKFSALVLLVLVISIASQLGMKILDYAVIAGVAALLLNLINMSCGYLAGRYLLNNEAQGRTLSLEVGVQNGTMALLITSTILQSPEMSIAPSIYSLIMFVTASLFTMMVLRKDRRTQAAAGV